MGWLFGSTNYRCSMRGSERGGFFCGFYQSLKNLVIEREHRQDASLMLSSNAATKIYLAMGLHFVELDSNPPPGYSIPISDGGRKPGTRP